jgi:hypothetical protein
MDVFRAMVEGAFVTEIVTSLQEENPEIWSSPDARACVQICLEKARGHGFPGGETLAELVTLFARQGPLFDSYPEIEAILRREFLSPSERLEALESLPTRIWDEVTLLAGPDPWRLLPGEAADAQG